MGAALSGDATMLFGVPTMYRRLAEAAEADPGLAAALARARLLVSGSAALPAAEHERLTRLTGRSVLERYGMTETLMNTGIRVGARAAPGTVGPPLPGVELRLVDDDGDPLLGEDDETIGEVQVRGPNLFLGYLNRPDATAAAFTDDGWFITGDMATRGAGGYIRLVGRRATDLIKSGGYKIGAGEIEAALREHPAVADAAVTGEPDDDLGERIIAWVVLADGGSRRPPPTANGRVPSWSITSPRNWLRTSAPGPCTSSTSCRATTSARSRSSGWPQLPGHKSGVRRIPRRPGCRYDPLVHTIGLGMTASRTGRPTAVG